MWKTKGTLYRGVNDLLRSSISDRFLRSEQGMRKWEAGKVWGQEVLHKLTVHTGKRILHTACKGEMGQSQS